MIKYLKQKVIDLCIHILWHLCDDALYTTTDIRTEYGCKDGKDAYGEVIPEDIEKECMDEYTFHMYDNFDKVKGWLNCE